MGTGRQDRGLREAFVPAELVDGDDMLLAEDNGLIVRLLAGQP
nr:hypothetical protein [Mycobacterium uberis]